MYSHFLLKLMVTYFFENIHQIKQQRIYLLQDKE